MAAVPPPSVPSNSLYAFCWVICALRSRSISSISMRSSACTRLSVFFLSSSSFWTRSSYSFRRRRAASLRSFSRFRRASSSALRISSRRLRARSISSFRTLFRVPHPFQEKTFKCAQWEGSTVQIRREDYHQSAPIQLLLDLELLAFHLCCILCFGTKRFRLGSLRFTTLHE